ncbi:His-Xaa-Ser system radical SAM maturase HxsB [Marinifilum fragile]|uniref:His-Xaa-Ser system radical SAM maturase HxsB n=1 Tax=Marinifilum fragile TaxID=570161 RepID=UPI002AAC21D3|nr:His-Xaa-Ser system radical SAM maturase HxsB [Marinifilum fragile]
MFESVIPYEEFCSKDSKYYLLPFKFKAFLDDLEILVNFSGDFLIVDRGTVDKILAREIMSDEDLYADLIANHFISEKKYPKLIDVLATKYRTKKSFLDGFTALHIFVLTLRCNHSCKYCQVSSIESKTPDEHDISYEHLDLSIEMMFKSPAQAITMEFQGGEPLLVFDKLKYAVERAEELNNLYKKDISFVLCSNSTLLTEEILQYMKEHEILLSTSLDGPLLIHDGNRIYKGCESYQVATQKIKLAKSILGEDRVSALMTTTNNSLNAPEDIVNSYIENGFSSIFFRSINPYGEALNDSIANYTIDEFIEFYKRGLDYIIDLNKQGVFFVEEYASIILKKILTPFTTGFVDLQSPSGIVNGVVVYNYDGFVYASDEARMMAERGDNYFQLGHISNSYNEIFYGDKVVEIAKEWSNEALAGCSDCCYQMYCGADPVRNYSTQQNMHGFRPTSDFCKKNMQIIDYLFALMYQDEDVFQIFQSWIVNKTN